MREIKFRAWDKENKCWLKLEEILLNKNNVPVRVMAQGYSTSIGIVNPEQVALMQYTGLKDKNGYTEIFEYDIIDENGIVKGNYYENKYLLEKPINFLIKRMGTKEWKSTEQEADKRGCKYAE